MRVRDSRRDLLAELTAESIRQAIINECIEGLRAAGREAWRSPASSYHDRRHQVLGICYGIAMTMAKGAFTQKASTGSQILVEYYAVTGEKFFP